MGEVEPMEAWDLAVSWCLQMDPISKEERNKAHDEREQFIKQKVEVIENE
jgi:hypothetical protein